MLKNCVFRPDVDTVAWIKAAGIRAIKTMAQTFVATIGTAAVTVSYTHLTLPTTERV